MVCKIFGFKALRDASVLGLDFDGLILLKFGHPLQKDF